MCAVKRTTITTGMLALLLCAASIAHAQQPAQQPAQPQPGRQEAQEAMQGGGMTDERGLADDTARGHYRLGTTAYDQGRFAEAAQEFEEAYRLSERPALMYNAYIAHRDANDIEAAARCLRIFLERETEVRERTNLEARLRSMEEELERRRAAEAELEVQRQANEQRPEPPPPPQSGPEVWPYALVGIGAAALVAGAITGGVAFAEAEALATDCPNATCGPEIVDFDDRLANIDTLGIVTDVLLFGGGAIALTGVILAIALGASSAPAAERADEPEVTASCGPTGCAASLRARF
jgi:tetratricopeptide (TPR) repeat protein